MRLISVVTPCYNEEGNVEELCLRVRAVFDRLPQYRYEHIFIDNASTDNTVAILKRMAAQDPHVKIIVNARNFGHLRSPIHGMLQAHGDAVISIVADLQDPPEMIPDFIEQWEEGHKIVVGVKNQSKESPVFFAVRKFYYDLVTRCSETPLIKNFTGFGLYDKTVMDVLRGIDDPYPYFRGLICEIGFPRVEIPYTQPVRTRGFTKNNLYTLYDVAMLGFTNHSKVPLRLATFTGFGSAIVCIIVAMVYLVYKLVHWNSFSLGMAPIVIGFFFISAVQLIFIGIIGEYVGAVLTQVLKRPLVVERERVNFDQSIETTVPR